MGSVFTSPAMHYHYPYAFSDPNAPPSSNGPLRSSGGPPDMSRSMGPLPGPTRRPGGGPGKSTGFQPVSFPIQTSYQEPPRMVRQAQSAYFPSGVPAPYPSSQPRARPATFHESSWTNNQGMWPLQGGAPHGAQPSHSAHSAPQSPAEPALPDLNFEFFTTVEPSSKMFPEANPNFSQKVCRFFKEGQNQESFECSHCHEPGTLEILRHSHSARTKCGHYVACNECRWRVVRQILRCPGCCEELIGTYPTCGPNCQEECQNRSQSLGTASCPRCEQKLSKEKCQKSCNRTDSEEYKEARSQLNSQVATMVLHPDLCLQVSGMRPCPHFTLCTKHQTITKGRPREPNCPGCKQLRRSQPRVTYYP